MRNARASLLQVLCEKSFIDQTPKKPVLKRKKKGTFDDRLSFEV
jgi:hypothetical protein